MSDPLRPGASAEGLGEVLLVGGTGMLAGASRWIAQQARQLTLVARAPEALARELGAEAVALDWKQPNAPERMANRVGRQAWRQARQRHDCRHSEISMTLALD